MKLKLSQIVDSQSALLRLASERYAAHISYRIQKNMRALDAERKICEKAMIDLVMNKYGGKETSPGMYEAAEDKRDECGKELKALLEEEVEIDIKKIALTDIKEIAPLDMMVLEWMFDEPEGPAVVAAEQTQKRKRK